jgi:hypothetical protein
MCSKKPDTSGINKAAQQTSNTGQEALDWYKQEAARTQAQRDAAAAADLGVSQAAAAQMNAQTAQAATDNAFLNGTIRPAQAKFVGDASNYGSVANQDAAAERATADVRNAQAGQQTAAAQSLARMGYNPTVNSTKIAATQALQEAGAATQARKQTYDTGLAMEGQASGLGAQVAGNANANNTGAAQAGGVSTGAAGAGLTAASSGAALMGAGFGTALQGSQASGNLYGQSAQLGQQDNSGMWGALGSLGGGAIARWSSVKLKAKGPAMPDKVALEAVADNDPDEHGGPPDGDADEMPPVPRGNPQTAKFARMSNDAWRYKPGVADGAVHVGPYAEEAQRHLGDKVAPGGKKLDMVESAHANGRAIAELASRVKKLTHALGG